MNDAIDQSSDSNEPKKPKSPMAQRFRGYLPVVIDIETGGFNAATDAMLEIAMVTTVMDEEGLLLPDKVLSAHIAPFEGANIEKSALDFTGIDLNDESITRETEKDALDRMFKEIRKAVKSAGCTRAILVAHNAAFDQGFLNAAIERAKNKRSPFHPFSSFDTATLAGLAFGQTVLAKACDIAGIEFDNKSAHSAEYDTVKTADLFCTVINRWKEMGGWAMIQKEEESIVMEKEESFADLQHLF
jgi:ribonuclease T